VQKDYSTETSPQIRIKRKFFLNSVRCYATIAMHLTFVQGYRVLHGTFGKKKVKYVSERTQALC